MSQHLVVSVRKVSDGSLESISITSEAAVTTWVLHGHDPGNGLEITRIKHMYKLILSNYMCY